MSRADVLTIGNRKGGTGKTATTVNLAATVANRGKKVLILDLDSQSHCAPGLGLSRRSEIPFLHTCFLQPDLSISKTLRRSEIPGVWLSQADPAFIHNDFSCTTGHLRQQLHTSGILDVFDLVILDTPPSLDQLLQSALLAADAVIVPFVPHYLSYDGIKQLVQLMYDIKQTDNPSLTLLGFVPSMVATAKCHHRAVLNQVETLFGSDRLLPGIRNDIRVAEAFEAGLPVHLFAPNSRAAQDYRLLASTVLDHLTDGIQPANAEKEAPSRSA